MTTGRVFLHAIYCSCDYSFLPLCLHILTSASLSHFREALLAPTIPDSRHFHQQNLAYTKMIYTCALCSDISSEIGFHSAKKEAELSEEDKGFAGEFGPSGDGAQSAIAYNRKII